MTDSRKVDTAPALGPNELRPLGKNANGYLGETIHIDAVLGDCVAAAEAHRWTVDRIPVDSQESLLAFVRRASVTATSPSTSGKSSAILPSSAQGPRIYISSGIHGDEPAAPLAVRQLLRENHWPAHVDLWLCPCLNPSGFRLQRRENAQGFDLNRQYLRPQAPEILAHIAWLHQQPPFDLCLCLHEDWEAHGFYVYELNPDDRPSLAESIVASASVACPIDLSDSIEGRPAHAGIIRPKVDPRSRPDWPEAFFLLTHKTRLSYTLEAPSDFPVSARVAALVAAVRAAIERVSCPSLASAD